MVVFELRSRSIVDESFIEEPSDSAALRSDVAESVPDRDEVWMAFIELVLESPECTSPSEGVGQLSADCEIADAASEVDHVLEPDVGGKRVDWDQVEVVEVDGVLPIDTGVTGPERQLACSRVDQPSVFEVSLILQRSGDLFDVDCSQVEHFDRLRSPAHRSS